MREPLRYKQRMGSIETYDRDKARAIDVFKVVCHDLDKVSIRKLYSIGNSCRIAELLEV